MLRDYPKRVMHFRVVVSILRSYKDAAILRRCEGSQSFREIVSKQIMRIVFTRICLSLAYCNTDLRKLLAKVPKRQFMRKGAINWGNIQLRRYPHPTFNPFSPLAWPDHANFSKKAASNAVQRKADKLAKSSGKTKLVFPEKLWEWKCIVLWLSYQPMT